MLDLLLSVSLNSLEQGLQALLVLLLELFHLTHKSDLQIFIHDGRLILLLLFDHRSHGVSLVIVLH